MPEWNWTVDKYNAVSQKDQFGSQGGQSAFQGEIDFSGCLISTYIFDSSPKIYAPDFLKKM